MDPPSQANTGPLHHLQPVAGRPTVACAPSFSILTLPPTPLEIQLVPKLDYLETVDEDPELLPK